MLLLYLASGGETAGRLEDAIGALIRQTGAERVHGLSQLRDRLHAPLEASTTLVFLAESREELERLISMGSWLTDVRLVLILPDSIPETVTLGHRLRPRFVSYADGDFADVAAVLPRMLGIAGMSLRKEAQPN